MLVYQRVSSMKFKEVHGYINPIKRRPPAGASTLGPRAGAPSRSRLIIDDLI